MKKALLFLLVLVGVATVSSAQVANEWIKLYEPHTYNDMPYRLLKPMNFDSEKSYPVIVSLHSGGRKGTDNLKQMKTGLRLFSEEHRRKDYPCFIIAPQSQGEWSPIHLQNIKDIINDLPSVDMDRIYVLGHSMGGAGTYKFIQTDKNYFAAAAPSAGSGLARHEGLIDPSKITDVPIWVFHGDQDGICPYERQQRIFAKVKELGGNMKFTTWKGDNHGVAVNMLTGADNGSTQFSSSRCDPEPDFLKWLFAQKQTADSIKPQEPKQTPKQIKEMMKKRTADWMKLHEPKTQNGMPYRLLRPINFDPAKSYPVVVSLHSAGGKGSDNLKQMRTGLQIVTDDKIRKAYPCYTISPQSLEGWNEQHLQNIKEIIDELPSVDMNRIYVYGHSMGGGGTYRFIQYDPNYFAAAAASAGGRHTSIDAELIKDVPLWTFFGEHDKIEDTRKLFAKMQEIGGNMKFTTWIGDGHGVGVQMITGADNGVTQLSSERCDTEAVFLKWLFTKKLTKK